jgi:hypothetical protein
LVKYEIGIYKLSVKGVTEFEVKKTVDVPSSVEALDIAKKEYGKGSWVREVK